MTTTVKITGMSCGHCVMSVKNALKDLPGIRNLNVMIGQASFESDGAVDTKKIKEIVEEEGYEVVSVN